MTRSSSLLRITDNKLISWIAILTMVAYPISASLTLFFGFESTPLNVFYRAIIVFLVITFFLKSNLFFHQQISLTNKLFLVFWLVFIVRLFYDVVILEITVGNFGVLHILTFAIGGCLLPFLSISVGSKKIDTAYFLRYYFLTTLISNLLILIAIVYQTGGLNPNLLLQRISIMSSQNENALVINTILISFMGEILLLISAYLLFENKLRFKRYLLISALIIGVFNLVIGASRGPILGAVAGLLFLFFAFRPRNFRIKKTVFITFAVVSFLIALIINTIDLTAKFAAFNRIVKFIENRQSSNQVKEARDYQWEAAWNQFLENPIIGDKIVNDYDQFYPHNIYLEVLMSTGIVGAIPFFLGLFLVFYNIFKRKREPYPFILLPFLIAGFTSGSLYTNVGIWVAIGILNLKMPINDLQNQQLI